MNHEPLNGPFAHNLWVEALWRVLNEPLGASIECIGSAREQLRRIEVGYPLLVSDLDAEAWGGSVRIEALAWLTDRTPDAILGHALSVGEYSAEGLAEQLPAAIRAYRQHAEDRVPVPAERPRSVRHLHARSATWLALGNESGSLRLRDDLGVELQALRGASHVVQLDRDPLQVLHAIVAALRVAQLLLNESALRDLRSAVDRAIGAILGPALRGPRPHELAIAAQGAAQTVLESLHANPGGPRGVFSLQPTSWLGLLLRAVDERSLMAGGPLQAPADAGTRIVALHPDGTPWAAGILDRDLHPSQTRGYVTLEVGQRPQLLDLPLAQIAERRLPLF